MKQILAEKCKDAWLVEIIDRRIISCESDVLKLVRQEGMKIKDKVEEGDIIIKIYGE